MIIIEHKLDELIDWVDSVLVLAPGGRLLFRGDPARAFYDHADGLCEAGVWRPQTAEVVAALREAGWEVPGSPLAIEDTVAALAQHSGPGGPAALSERRPLETPGQVAPSERRGDLTSRPDV